MDKKSVTTLTLKQINKHTVYRYIYRQRETSKFQIRECSYKPEDMPESVH